MIWAGNICVFSLKRTINRTSLCFMYYTIIFEMSAKYCQRLLFNSSLGIFVTFPSFSSFYPVQLSAASLFYFDLSSVWVLLISQPVSLKNKKMQHSWREPGLLHLELWCLTFAKDFKSLLWHLIMRLCRRISYSIWILSIFFTSVWS